MSRNGSGVYSLPAGNPVVTNTTISSTWANNTLTDIATALTGSVASDGQTPMTGSLDLNSNKIVNLAVGTVAGDAVEYTQATSAVAITGGSIAGVTGSFTTLAASGAVSFTGTGVMLIPKGTTAQRPVSPANGEMRYNTDTGQFEGYQGGAWGQLGGGATGGGGDEVFVENSTVITTSYTLSTGKNASSVGPITINAGATITVGAGQRWVVL
jgi:hypothetical protein